MPRDAAQFSHGAGRYRIRESGFSSPPKCDWSAAARPLDCDRSARIHAAFHSGEDSTGKETAVNQDVKPQLISFDDNIRGIGGHFFELATLLVSAASEFGFRSTLATHSSFQPPHELAHSCDVLPVFRPRRMVRWSLGIDGASLMPRHPDGRPAGEDPMAQARQALRDMTTRPDRNPRRMLQQWADDFSRLLARTRPDQHDTLLMNTGDDFALLALARALEQTHTVSRLTIHVVFHFAIDETGERSGGRRFEHFRRQMKSTLDRLSQHRIHLHATTEPLAEQLRRAELGVPIRAVPYPTRPRHVPNRDSAGGPLKVLFAGLPRAEKGRDQIAALLGELAETLLTTDEFRMSMQMPATGWQRMIPESLQAAYRTAQERCEQRLAPNGPFEIPGANLPTETYHRWLDTADIGLFLYEPARYVARCSGVLLEMLSRGVPVIVPDGCWLADQVRAARRGGFHVGAIYQSRSEIPQLLFQMKANDASVRASARRYARVIAQRHSATNTLRTMGLAAAAPRRAAA